MGMRAPVKHILTAALSLACGLLLCRHATHAQTGKVSGAPVAGQEIQTVRFCDLVRHPKRYDQKIVRVAASLIQLNLRVVHGDDPFLFDPSCRGGEVRIYLAFAREYRQPEELTQALAPHKPPNEAMWNSRTDAVVVGRFEGGGSRKFGDRGWSPSAFTVMRVERVKSAAVNVPWPEIGMGEFGKALRELFKQ